MIERYIINNQVCCKSSDVKKLEEAHSRVIDSHVFVSPEEFKEMATLVMCNDDPNQDADIHTLHSLLNQFAIKCLGYDDWFQAYHEL